MACPRRLFLYGEPVRLRAGASVAMSKRLHYWKYYSPSERKMKEMNVELHTHTHTHTTDPK